MPLIEVTCSSRVSGETKRALRDALPHLVSLAVECEAEPYDGQLVPGDVIIRFHDSGPMDRFDLDLLIEVKSTWFEDRAQDRQRRVDEIQQGVEAILIGPHLVGTYLTLPVAAWAQTE